MSWRDRLRPASFRGVPFQVLDWEDERGRRAAVHVYPQRNRVSVEDLGRAPRRHRLTGFVIGDDYLERKADLDQAVERIPSGFPFKAGKFLVHPFLGLLKVHCESIRWRAISTRGRMASFVAVFVEVDEDFEPLAPVANPEGELDEVAAEAEGTIGAAAEAAIQTSGVESVREATAGALRSASAAIGSLQSFFAGPTAAIQSVTSAATGLAANASALATAPAELVEDVLDAVAAVGAAVGNALGALTAYEALLDRFDAPLIPGLGSNATAARANAAATSSLFLQAAAIAAARQASAVEWGSYEEAIDRRDQLLDRIAELELDAAPPVFRQLARVKAVLVDAVPPTGEDLPRIQELELAKPTPALVLAYRVHDDVGRAGEIAERNRVRHPSFLPALEPVQVLSE